MEVVLEDPSLDDFEEELDFEEWVACFAFAQSIIELALAIVEFILPTSLLHH